MPTANSETRPRAGRRKTDAAPPPAAPARPGPKTTELWVTVATLVADVAAAIAGKLPPTPAAIAAAVAAAGYALSRGLAKAYGGGG